ELDVLAEGLPVDPAACLDAPFGWQFALDREAAFHQRSPTSVEQSRRCQRVFPRLFVTRSHSGLRCECTRRGPAGAGLVGVEALLPPPAGAPADAPMTDDGITRF